MDIMREGDDDLEFSSKFPPKVGTKKLRKLEEKAARRAHREVSNGL